MMSKLTTMRQDDSVRFCQRTGSMKYSIIFFALILCYQVVLAETEHQSLKSLNVNLHKFCGQSSDFIFTVNADFEALHDASGSIWFDTDQYHIDLLEPPVGMGLIKTVRLQERLTDVGGMFSSNDYYQLVCDYAIYLSCDNGTPSVQIEPATSLHNSVSGTEVNKPQAFSRLD